MEKIAKEEFSGNTRLLSVNIDLIGQDKDYILGDLETITDVEKKSKDTLFLKTSVLANNKIITYSSAIWAKGN
tara:strand:+ start:674 stop:892 length:219 start_codon:yes stop_codon:yes gene_type:complete